MQYKAWFDGSSKGNPGPSTAGWLIEYKDVFFKDEVIFSIIDRTNNYAEYIALYRLLHYIKKSDISSIEIYGDSKLVINQVLGKWKCKSDNLKELYFSTKKLYNELKSKVKLTWVPREQNEKANKLVY